MKLVCIFYQKKRNGSRYDFCFLLLFHLTATAFLWVVAQVLLVGVEPLAPARQFVEVALLVALVVVIEWLRCDNIMIVMGVKHMVQQTYT